MRKIGLIAFFLLVTSISGEEKASAKDFLQMKSDKAMKLISGMSKIESAELITEIRKEAKKDFKQIDNFYFLISHLEEIKAVEVEQKRLKSLNLVYGLGLTLLLSFLLYVFMSQRKIIKEINMIKKD